MKTTLAAVLLVFGVTLFGTSCSLPLDANWQDSPTLVSMQTKYGDQYFFGKSLTEINTYVFYQIAYEKDRENGHQEYWQSPETTLSRGTGDCDDKAILFAYFVYIEFGSKVEFSIEFNSLGQGHIACYFEGNYYDPTNNHVGRYPLIPESYKWSFDDVMSKVGFTIF